MIKADKLSKTFRLWHEGQPTLKSYALALLRRKLSWETLYALKSIDLEIKQGEFFGIIGANGSGKSTLLKILAGIIQPSSGRLAVGGRLSPFLELGVGFQGELTGRENIYLYGAISGMTRKEINRCFDEIVAFSGLEKFLDTKIKHYSSGMQVRLAFATAIQTPAEIYLIDEVLAVGDAAFQHKCFEVFDRFKRQGKTMIFVSHDLEAVRRVCGRAAVLEKGELILVGSPAEAIEKYVYQPTGPGEDADRYQKKIHYAGGTRWGGREIEITKVRLLNGSGQPASRYISLKPLVLEMTYRLDRPVPPPVFGISLHRSDGSLLYGTNSQIESFSLPWPPAEGVEQKIYFRIEALPLLEGDYLLSVTCHDLAHHPYDWHNRLYSFSVVKDRQQIGEVNLQGRFSLISSPAA